MVRIFTIGRVVMKDDKVALYAALIRASLILIFIVALSAGTFGLVAISHMLIQHMAPRPEFLSADITVAESVR